MSLGLREIASAVARSRAGSNRAPKLPATLKGEAAGYLRELKKRGARVGIWAVRGEVFARVMVAGTDARLSGAELRVLIKIALHLHHLGRSKGMMTIASLADDAMVTERTIRNALRVLEAAKFLSVKYRLSGQLVLMLDRRFKPGAVVPGDKSVDKSPRRSAPRKKISTNGNSSRCEELPLKDECKDSAARTARAESTASSPQPQTANGNIIVSARQRAAIPPSYAFIRQWRDDAGTMWYEFGPHDPPRKRAPPVASG